MGPTTPTAYSRHVPEVTQLRAQLARVYEVYGREGVLQLLPHGVSDGAVAAVPVPPAPRQDPQPTFTYEDLVCIVVITFALVAFLDLMRR